MARVINGELAELAQVPACCLKSEEDKLALVRHIHLLVLFRAGQEHCRNGACFFEC